MDLVVALRLRSVLLAVVLVQPASGQAHKLSGALALTPEKGGVREFVVAPDGAHVAFVGDLAVDEVFELWSAPTDHSAPALRLSGTLVEGGDVLASGPEVSANNVVVYTANAVDPDRSGIYAVPIDGSAPPVELYLGSSLGFPETLQFRLAPDGNHVVFVRWHYPAGWGEIYSVPIDGSTSPVRLAPGSSFGSSFVVSPDSTRVVSWDGYVLWSAPIDASSAPISIGDVSVTYSDLLLEFSQDGRRLVYHGNYTPGYFASFETGVAWTDGSAPAVVLSTSFVRFEGWQLFQDGNRILIGEGLTLSVRSTLDGSSIPLTTLPSGAAFRWVALTPDEQWGLFGYSSTGIGEANRVGRARTDASSATLVPGPWSNVRGDVLFTSDGSQVVLFDSLGIYALATDWASPRVTLATNGWGLLNARILPGDANVLFTADMAPDAVTELYVRPLDASAPAQRLDTATSGAGVAGFATGESGTHAVWLQSDGVFDPARRLLGEPIDLSTPADSYHGPLPGGPPVLGDVEQFLVSDDGRMALYRADIELDEQYELVAVRPFDPRGPLRMNPPLAPDADVSTAFALARDGERTAFWITAGTSTKELWSARTDGSTPAVLLAAASFTGQPLAPAFTPDGLRVVFEPGATGLASVPADGSAAPVALVPTDLDVSRFELDSAGDTVLARGSKAGLDALYGAPVDGSTAAVRLTPAGAADVDVVDPRLVGSTVFFRADVVNTNFELYQVPLDGSAGPMRLSAPLGAGGSVTAYDVRAGVVVYCADAAVNGRFELYRVTAPSVSLALTAMPTAGDVMTDFALTSDGQRVVFRADPVIDQRFDLLSVPSDGSAAPTTIATPSGTTVDVANFQLDSTGAWVAFGMDLYSGGPAVELRVVSVTGGASRLLDTTAGEYQVTPEGRAVFATAFGPERLFTTRVPAGPIELMAEMAGGTAGEILSFQPVRGGRVFFAGNGEDGDVDELFLTFTDRSRREAAGTPGNGGTIVR